MEKLSAKKKTWLIAGIVIIVIGIGNLIAWLVGGVEGIKALYAFISDQILGIKWLNTVIESLVTAIFGATFATSLWGKAVIFFLYDSIKIFFLLSLLIFLISYIQSYFPPEKTKVILSKYKGFGANIMGALLGTLTPFCSCSSIPLFMGFTRAGISSGVTFSFLISSPLVDLGAFVLLVSTFGFPIAGIYVVVGLILAVIGGTIIEKTGIGKEVREYISNSGTTVSSSEIIEPTKKERAAYAWEQLKGVVKKVWIYIFIGVAIGATIHNFVPTEWVEAVLGQDKWYSVFVATFVGVPMYADIFGTIPVAEALFAKGVGVGTILAFMMSVTALSLPSVIMLSKAVKPKLLAVFMAVVIVGIIAIGFVFNALNFLFI